MLTSLGKELRLKKIFDRNSDTVVIIPMDHPTEGYFKEFEDPRPIISELAKAGVNAFLFRRGLARYAKNEYAGRSSLIIRVTSRSSLHHPETNISYATRVEEAVRMGADAVAATLFVGSEKETDDLTAFGVLSDACDEWGIPLLGEMVPVRSSSKPYDGPFTVDDVRIAVRLGCEEGADFIKTFYTGDSHGFAQVVKYSTVPVILAGGAKANTSKEFLAMVKGAMEAGAKGVAIGRNVWGSSDPVNLTRALFKIIRERKSVEEALTIIE